MRSRTLSSSFLVALAAIVALASAGCSTAKSGASENTIATATKTIVVTSMYTVMATVTTSRPAQVSESSPVTSTQPSLPTSTTSSAAILSFNASVTCSRGIDSDPITFTSLTAAWAATPKNDNCDANTWTDVSAGLQASIERTDTDASEGLIAVLAGMCGQRAGYPIDFIRSEGQIAESKAMLLLCPDHPDAKKIRMNIKAAQVVVDAEAREEAEKATGVGAGTWAEEGVHLVGPDIKPGKWQSVGDRVVECYWEISDAQGNIIDNNFISIAPKFTITIPKKAAGFTNNGCEFKKVG